MIVIRMKAWNVVEEREIGRLLDGNDLDGNERDKIKKGLN